MNELPDYYCREMLRNAAEVTIRTVRADDQHRIMEAPPEAERSVVSPHAYGYQRASGSNDPDRISPIDHTPNVMLLVTIHAARNELVIGRGSYEACAASDDWPTAKVAFAVEEDFQGIGIAGHLLKHLTRIARDRGITQFDAEVPTANRAMLNTFANSKLPMRRRVDRDTVHVSLMLSIGRVDHSPSSARELLMPRIADERQPRIRPSVVVRET